MNQPKKERFKTSVGGQALMEGIMMRGPKQMCCAVRKPDGTIETKLDPTPAHGVWMKIPLVRGAIAMIESMIVGYRYMMYSAQVSMGDDYDPAEEETAFEKWVGEHLGEKAENALLTVAAVLGGLLAIVLFTVLPTFLVGGVNRLLPLGRWGKVVLEAVLKVAIFLSYMVGISKMKEIHRVFEYHGAEHKTIACYEAGDPLTVENVRKYTRFHPRCGTSFLILVVIVSVFCTACCRGAASVCVWCASCCCCRWSWASATSCSSGAAGRTISLPASSGSRASGCSTSPSLNRTTA